MKEKGTLLPTSVKDPPTSFCTVSFIMMPTLLVPKQQPFSLNVLKCSLSGVEQNCQNSNRVVLYGISGNLPLPNVVLLSLTLSSPSSQHVIHLLKTYNRAGGGGYPPFCSHQGHQAQIIHIHSRFKTYIIENTS